MKAILAAAALTLLSAPAFAQSWNGFYGGLHLGGMTVPGTQFVGSNLATPGTPAGSATYAAETAQNLTGSTPNVWGSQAGVQIGYNWRLNQIFVVGVEADISKVSQGAGGFTRSQPFAGFPGFTVNSSLAAEKPLGQFGTVRARLGYVAADSWLVYLTGGLAYGRTDTTTTYLVTAPGTSLASPNGTFGGRSWRTGYAVGGGVEYAIHRNLSLKAEGLFYDLGSSTAQTTFDSLSAGVFITTTGVVRTTNFNGAIARIGLNYQF